MSWEPTPVKTITPTEVDPLLVAAIEAAFEVRVGVVFDGGRRLYVYNAPATAHIGSLVLTPANAYRPEPTIATVATLDPPAFNGPVKSVLQVLS